MTWSVASVECFSVRSTWFELFDSRLRLAYRVKNVSPVCRFEGKSGDVGHGFWEA
jgi:hypothetical protein